MHPGLQYGPVLSRLGGKIHTRVRCPDGKTRAIACPALERAFVFTKSGTRFQREKPKAGCAHRQGRRLTKPVLPHQAPFEKPLTFQTGFRVGDGVFRRSEEHTSELQSLTNLVCRLLLEKKKQRKSSRWRRMHSSKFQWRQTAEEQITRLDC